MCVLRQVEKSSRNFLPIDQDLCLIFPNNLFLHHQIFKPILLLITFPFCFKMKIYLIASYSYNVYRVPISNDTYSIYREGIYKIIFFEAHVNTLVRTSVTHTCAFTAIGPKEWICAS